MDKKKNTSSMIDDKLNLIMISMILDIREINM